VRESIIQKSRIGDKKGRIISAWLWGDEKRGSVPWKKTARKRLGPKRQKDCTRRELGGPREKGEEAEGEGLRGTLN